MTRELTTGDYEIMTAAGAKAIQVKELYPGKSLFRTTIHDQVFVFVCKTDGSVDELGQVAFDTYLSIHGQFQIIEVHQATEALLQQGGSLQ